jgi:hypothetical protein
MKKKYLCWFAHSELYVPYKTMVEKIVRSTSNSSNVCGVVNANSNHYRSIVMDVMRMNQGDISECSIVDKETNADATKFLDLLKDFDKPLWNGSTNHSKLFVIVHVFTIKLDHGLSETSYNRIVECARSVLLKRNRL